jgi:hypothetical protein
MSRTTAGISPGVKVRLHDLKEKFQLKSESQVIAYLIAVHDLTYDKLTHRQHEVCVEVSKEMQAQMVIR